MHRIEWIKNAVGLCANNEQTEEMKRNLFTELKKQWKAFSSEERSYIRNTIKSQFEINDCIYIFSAFLWYMDIEEFDEDVLDMIIQGDFNMIIGSMLEYQTFRMLKTKTFYKKRRSLRKKNVEAFQQVLDIAFPYTEPRNRNRKRIVIVTGQILSMRHAPTRVVISFVYALQKLGYEILMFVCPSDRRIPGDLWCLPWAENAAPDFDDLPMRLGYKDIEIKGYQITMCNACPKEYSMMFELIHAWNPLFVFDLGTVNPVVDLCSRFTTLAAFGMSIECPISEGSILIRLGKTSEEQEKEYAEGIDENQTQLFMEDSFPVLTDEIKGDRVREDFGLPQDKFLIAIVGNRLDLEIHEGFVSIMRRILKISSRIEFVIIGEVKQLRERLSDQVFQNRVHYLDYQKELLEVYTVLDLYLNPERAGGGFSGAMALIAGVPVITLPDCDVAEHVGEEFIVSDCEEMAETVERYVNDEVFYREKVSAAQNYKEQNTDRELENYVRKLVDGVIKLIDKEGEA